jgi:predicted GH43/DUF377 family glycosyl hydrolase
MSSEKARETAPEAFQLTRRGIVLTPDPAGPFERGGVLNPATAVFDATIYLFYRAVAETPVNYSRILIATCGPVGNEQLPASRLDLIALEPEAPYEVWANGHGGGVEDPRITPLDGAYYMAYTAYGTVDGVTMPRIALARAQDPFNWERLELPRFAPLGVDLAGQEMRIELDEVPNKDAILFPERIDGRYVMLHRPMFDPAAGLRQSIWLSRSRDLRYWEDHQLVLAPTLPWESLKVGGGTPPLRTPRGWLTFYHGVEGRADSDPERRYHAGALLLDLTDPARVVYQSPRPVLSPETAEETAGIVSNVVFPTGLVAHPDGLLAVYYGMADQAIGVATTVLPAEYRAPHPE